MMLAPLRVAQPNASTYTAWRRRAPFLRVSGVLFRSLRLLERAGAPLPFARTEDGLRIEVGTDCVTVNILVHPAVVTSGAAHRLPDPLRHEPSSAWPDCPTAVVSTRSGRRW